MATVKMVNPTTKKAPARASRTKNPPAVKVRYKYREKARKFTDDLMDAAAASGGALTANYLARMIQGALPDNTRKTWTDGGLAIATVVAMQFIAKKNRVLRSGLLGAVAILVARTMQDEDWATLQGMPRSGNAGADAAAARIASVLGAGPGRSGMGYLEAGSPFQSSLGYLEAGPAFQPDTAGFVTATY